LLGDYLLGWLPVVDNEHLAADSAQEHGRGVIAKAQGTFNF
jgi:hypothetical protein